MAPRAQSNSSSDTSGDQAAVSSPDPAADPTASVAGAVVDDQGQVKPDGPQGRGVVRPRTYGTGEGWHPGNVAPKTLFLDTASDKVVAKEPERGVALTRKGEPVEPFAARALADRKFKG